MLALDMLLVLLGNVTVGHVNEEFVQHVMSMDTTLGDPKLMWRAVHSHAIHHFAFLAIILWQFATACVLTAASIAWLLATRRLPVTKARSLSTIGLVMWEVLFVLGFMTIGGEWFAMWQSALWNGQDAAFRNASLGAFGLIFLHLPRQNRSVHISD
jgi:predicted small integral membrane protein